MHISETIALYTLMIVIGTIIGYLIRKYIAEARIKSAEEAAKKILEEANKDGQARKRELMLEAKEEIHKMRLELERESREIRADLQNTERRLIQKEETLDRRNEVLEEREKQLSSREESIAAAQDRLQQLIEKQRLELEKVSGMSSEEGKQLLLESLKDELQHEFAVMIKEAQTKAKEEAEKRARDIITCAIQRCAADHVAETTVSVVSLPNDEMKGRIIGREGRNIRAFETLTGIDLIIDDTPEAVIISGFDPVRREIARIALERLILDGRIHPARIEEMVNKAAKEVEAIIREEGEAAALETNVHGLHPELIRMLGRLKYRTSYGQNVLKHSIEVSHLAGIMAAELGVDVTLARRGGLLHDIGKAVDHEVDGSHSDIGADITRKYKESLAVIHCIRAHHADIEASTVEAVLVQAADAISAARPGARRETLEAYIKRLERLEDIADSFDCVEKAYAIQAGREIRIMVKPDKIDDVDAVRIAREVSKKIEEELEYPGQIKVTVIREVRAVEYAK